MKNPEKVIAYVVEWLRSYAEQSGMKGFVVVSLEASIQP
jgi:NH3-dependent NAD+ synthetase